MSDREEIRDLIENWALWRDAGDCERFGTVWHWTDAWKQPGFREPAMSSSKRTSRAGPETSAFSAFWSARRLMSLAHARLVRRR